MSVTDTLIAKPPPITEDALGTLRVGGTRVTLDSVIEAYLDGLTAEEIASEFSSLKLEDVYAVISHYLANQPDVDAYLASRRAEGDALQEQIEREVPPDGLRAKLLARLGKSG